MPAYASPTKDTPGAGADAGVTVRFLRWGYPALLVVLLLVLFARILTPGIVVFSNDGPLGGMLAAQNRAPGSMTGIWQDLNVLGTAAGTLPPSLSGLLLWFAGPWLYTKIVPAFALLLLALCSAFALRQLGLKPLAAVLGGLAAMFNTAFFSVACWGVPSHTITFAMCFLAIGLLAKGGGLAGWLRAALAGMAVGMGVMEGADVGGLFSLLVAAFVVYQGFAEPSNSVVAGVAKAGARLGLVAGCAAFLAAVAVFALVQTSMVGAAAAQQETRTKPEQWDWATQWSLPKVETLQFVVPGLFGYRMDTPEGGNYWGAVGRDPSWDRYYAGGSQGDPPPGFMRFTGGGIYTGVLVLLVAAWAATQGWRGKESVFSATQRRWIGFWCVVAAVALLLAWGRFAPFYQFFYALPYASTIRNPAKFAYFVNFALVMLFAYGVHGLSQRSLEVALTTGLGPVAAIKAWWKRSTGFDRRWAIGLGMAVGGSALAWLIYASSRKSLVAYLNEVQLAGPIADEIAGFSIRQAGIFVLLLALAAALVLLVLSGWCAGRRARLGAVLLGGLLLLDLGRANLPFVMYVDWQHKYATNPVIEFLREKPYEQRVSGLPFPVPQQLGLLNDLYRIEWAQHHFYMHNIQSLDIVQMPRMPEDLEIYERAWRTNGSPGLLRRWELTNNRYLLGPAGFAEGLNQQLDPVKRRFSVKLPFEIQPKPGVQRATKLEDLTAVTRPDGQYAVIEFRGALPRAKLYSQWSVNTNGAAVLQRLFDPAFDPQTEVIVDGDLAPSAAGATNAPGSVEFVSYAPRDIVLKADVKTPAILLLNDRYDGNWRVRVDGQPAKLMRANYLMRAVRLEPGTHTVEFQYRLPTGMLKVSVAAMGVTVLLCGLLVVVGRGRRGGNAMPKPGSAGA
jgi:hypothetical protein